MRHRDILLLGAGLTGAFFLGLGALTIDTPAESIGLAPAPAPDHGLAEAEPGQFGWLPAAVPQPLNGAYGEGSPGAHVAAAPGEAGIWSLPAEFADPE